LKPAHELGIGAIGTCQGHVLNELGEAEIATGDTLSAGGLSEGTSQVGLASACGPGDENDLVVTDPIAAGEPKDDGAIQAPWGSEVQILKGGWEAEFGLAEQPGKAAVLANRRLPLDEEGEAILEGEALDIGHGLLFIEGIGHASETEFTELGEGLFKKHSLGSQFEEV
jgi:hypothetical protein